MKHDEEAISLMMKVFFTSVLWGSVVMVVVGLVAFAAGVPWAWPIAAGGTVIFVFTLLIKPRAHGDNGS